MIVGKKKNDAINNIVDAIVILLHLTFGMSMFYTWFHDVANIPNRLDLLSITFFSYLFRFGSNFRLFCSKNKSIAVIFVLLYVFDILQNFFIQPREALLRIFVLIDIILFMEYVYSIYVEKKTQLGGGRTQSPLLSQVTASFEVYTVYNVMAVILCTGLLLVGVISAYDNPVTYNSLIRDNAGGSTTYYFPGYLSLALSTSRGLATLDIPVLTGLSHEPHVLFLIIGPCFYFLLMRFSNRIWPTVLLYVSFLLVLVIATSTTAILVFMVTIALETVYNVFLGKRKFFYLIILFFVGVLVYWFLYYGQDIVDSISFMMEDKISGGSKASRDVSEALMRYMFNPTGLFGMGNMPNSYYDIENRDIGAVTFILDVVFISLFLYKIIVNIFSSSRTIHLYGLGVLYFFLHTMKLGVWTFFYPYLSFFVVLIVIIDAEKDQMELSHK